MQAAVRPYVMAGVALLGASFFAVAPVVPVPDIPIADPAVRLADSAITDALDGLLGTNIFSDVAGIPWNNVIENLFNDIANIPYNLFEAPYNVFPADFTPADETGPTTVSGALNELAASLNYMGSWWVYDATNIYDWDPGDPPKLLAAVNTLLPFPALSEPLGQQLNIIAEAELPEFAGCTYPNECDDPFGIYSQVLQVSLQQLTDGYTFPAVDDIYSGDPLPWSGETVQLDLAAPLNDFLTSLEADPSSNPIQLPTFEEVSTALSNLATAIFNGFNPFVPGTILGWDPFSGLFTDLSSFLSSLF